MKGKSLINLLTSSSLVFGSVQAGNTEELPQQQVSQKLRYSDEWIKREAQKAIENIENSVSLSQIEYFTNLVRAIYTVKKYIVFRGYDAPFMEWEYTIEMLETMVQYRGVNIYALLPYGLNTSLDQLAENSELSGSIVIKRTDKPLERGYILFDDWITSLWDSTIPSHYRDEIAEAYLRVLFIDMDKNNILGRQFLIETGQDSVYSNLPHNQGEPLFPRLEYYK